MTTKHTITLTCDLCKRESNSAYSWARISISGSTENLVLSPDRHYDICGACWMDRFHRQIYPRQHEPSEL